MMKIMTDSSYIELPITTNNIYLITNDFKEDIFNYLNTYFGNKKKTLCTIYDDNNKLLKCADVEFIYFSKSECEMISLFKNKGYINKEIKSFMMENPEYFKSLEYIRDGIHNLLNDVGMFKLLKIMNNGNDNFKEVEINELDLSNIISMLILQVKDTKNIYMGLYNLALFLNRNKTRIVYLDYEIDEEASIWLKRLIDDKTIVIIDNELYYENDILNPDILILKENEKAICINVDNEEIEIISYMLKSLIKKYIYLQNEKYIDILDKYDIDHSAFIFKNSKHKTSK